MKTRIVALALIVAVAGINFAHAQGAPVGFKPTVYGQGR